MATQGGSFFRDSSWSMVARLWMAASRGIGLILISRALGPEGFGIYAVVLNTYLVLVMVGSLGLEQANTFFAARYPSRTRALFSNALASSVILGVLSIASFALVARVCSGWLFDANSVSLMYEAMWFLPIAILHNQLAGMIVGRGWFGWYASGELVKWSSYILALVIMSLLGWLNVRSALFGFFCSILMTAILHAMVVYRRTLTTEQAMSINRDLLKQTTMYGWRAFSVNLVNALNFRFDLYLVKFFRTSAEVGYYSLGVSLAEVLLYFARSINMVLFSRISSNVKQSHTLTPAISRHAVALVLGFIAAMLAFKDPVILLMFGDAYANSANVVTLMLPGILAQTITLVLIADLMGRNSLTTVLWSGILCFVVMVGLDLLWIPWLGVNAAAAASSIAYLSQSIFLLVTHSRSSQQSAASYLFLGQHEVRSLFMAARARGRA